MSCRMGCEEPEVSNGLCDRCRKRKARGGDLGAPKQERLERVQRAEEASLDLADADPEDDADYDRRKANWKAAISRYRDPIAAKETGRQGGIERAARLTPERRQEIARMGAIARAVKLSPDARRRIAVKARSAHKARNRLAYAQASERTAPGKAGNGAAEEQEP